MVAIHFFARRSLRDLATYAKCNGGSPNTAKALGGPFREPISDDEALPVLQQATRVSKLTARSITSFIVEACQALKLALLATIVFNGEPVPQCAWHRTAALTLNRILLRVPASRLAIDRANAFQ